MPIFVERSGKLALGKAGPARGRDRAGIDQELDLGALEFGHHRVGLGLLVADGEQRTVSCRSYDMAQV